MSSVHAPVIQFKHREGRSLAPKQCPKQGEAPRVLRMCFADLPAVIYLGDLDTGALKRLRALLHQTRSVFQVSDVDAALRHPSFEVSNLVVVAIDSQKKPAKTVARDMKKLRAALGDRELLKTASDGSEL